MPLLDRSSLDIKAPTGNSVKGGHRKWRDARWKTLRIRKEVVEFSLSGTDFASQLDLFAPKEMRGCSAG